MNLLDNDTLECIAIIASAYIVIKEFGWWTWRRAVLKWIEEHQEDKVNVILPSNAQAKKVEGQTEVTESNIKEVIRKFNK